MMKKLYHILWFSITTIALLIGFWENTYAATCTTNTDCWVGNICDQYVQKTTSVNIYRDTSNCVGCENWGGSVIVWSARVFNRNDFQWSTAYGTLYTSKTQIPNCIATKKSDGSCYQPASYEDHWPYNISSKTVDLPTVTKTTYNIPYPSIAVIYRVERYNSANTSIKDYWRGVINITLSSWKTWSCVPSTTANSLCGSVNGQTISSLPTKNLCASGSNSISTQEYSTGWTWQCYNYSSWPPTTSNCSAARVDLSCTTEEIAPITCDLTNPLLAWVCYKPWIGSSTILVKEWRVAINANDIDRENGTTTSAPTCDAGFTYSGSIDKCVKTTCTGGTVSKCDFVSKEYIANSPETISTYPTYYPATRWITYKGTAVDKYTLNTQEKIDMVNSYYLDKENSRFDYISWTPLYTTALENKIYSRYEGTSTLPGIVVYNWETLDFHVGNVSINTIVPWEVYWKALIRKTTNNTYCPTDGSWMPNLDPSLEYNCYYLKTSTASAGGTVYTYSSYQKETGTYGKCTSSTIIDPYSNNPVDPYRTMTHLNDIGWSISPSSACSDFGNCGSTTCKVFYTDAINPCSTNPIGGTLTCNWTATTIPPSTASNERWIVWQCKTAPTPPTCSTEIREPIRTTTTTPPAALLVNGTVRAATLINYSDADIKTNIEKIDNALANITKLNGYEFTWRDSWQPDFGVLAQEVEQVYATMVSTDSNGTKAVAYSELLAPIIEAIRDINTRIDELTIKAQEQSARLDALEK